MRRGLLLLLLVPLLLSCRHEFPPSSNDTDDRDRDRDGAVPLDQRPTPDQAVGDRFLPDAPPATCSAVPTGTGADCAKEESWGCVGVCDGKHRYACLKSPVEREIQCPESGACVCLVGTQKTPCPVSLDNGRFGCDRCREALQQGCCRP